MLVAFRNATTLPVTAFGDPPLEVVAVILPDSATELAIGNGQHYRWPWREAVADVKLVAEESALRKPCC